MGSQHRSGHWPDRRHRPLDHQSHSRPPLRLEETLARRLTPPYPCRKLKGTRLPREQDGWPTFAPAYVGRKRWATRISCHGAPPTSACAAFIKESRMKFANANKVYRKSGGAQRMLLRSPTVQTKSAGKASPPPLSSRPKR